MFPDTITQYFKVFFENVKESTSFNADMFSNMMKMKAACNLKLIYSPEHAEKMKEKIRRYFMK